jgi:uncharacterized protein (TIGR03437 family)
VPSVDPSRLKDAQSTPLGTSLASIAHEMFHAVQNGYIEEDGSTIDSYFEGTATVYGKTIDDGGALSVRTETDLLDLELLSSVAHSPNRYGSEDFWAYVAQAYNNGNKLTYLAGLFQALHGALGTNTPNPTRATLYGVLDGYLNTTFKKALADAYLEFVRDRALTHPEAGQLRAGENVVGLSVALFPNHNYSNMIDVTTCARTPVNLATPSLEPFSSLALTLTPAGNLPANSNGINLQVRMQPSNGAFGTTWKGWSYRTSVATLISTTTTAFPQWGKPGDPLVIVMSNIDRTSAGTMTLTIGCAGPTITSIAPVRGPVGTVVTINGSGFGVQADARTVTFNGVTATAITYVSDSQITAAVPANASTGDVIVTVNGTASNGVNFEVVSACSAQQNAGGDAPDTRTIELGKTSGTFNFTYNTYVQEDQMLVRYQNALLFDTGCVGTDGDLTKPISYNGTSTSISVQVIPNCKGGSGTAWDYSVSCP